MADDVGEVPVADGGRGPKQLLNAFVLALPLPPAHTLHWATWRRTSQALAQRSHYRRRLELRCRIGDGAAAGGRVGTMMRGATSTHRRPAAHPRWSAAGRGGRDARGDGRREPDLGRRGGAGTRRRGPCGLRRARRRAGLAGRAGRGRHRRSAAGAPYPSHTGE
ncbi:hypothetical protein FXF52_28205 [Micromonospora sp. MP36]|nr:hypothetical protein FXF52_28205 [Micromonospora sp. MP36]